MYQKINVKVYLNRSLVKDQDRLVSFVKQYNDLVKLHIGRRIQTEFTKGVKNIYENKVMQMNDSVLY